MRIAADCHRGSQYVSMRLPLQLQKFKNQHFQRIWCCEFEVPAVGYRNPLRKGEWKKIVISNKKNIVIKILGICAQTSKCCSQDDDVVRIFRNSAESRLSLQLYQACPGLKTKIQQQRRINLPEVNKTFYHFRSAGPNTQTLRCIESDPKKYSHHHLNCLIIKKIIIMRSFQSSEQWDQKIP